MFHSLNQAQLALVLCKAPRLLQFNNLINKLVMIDLPWTENKKGTNYEFSALTCKVHFNWKFIYWHGKSWTSVFAASFNSFYSRTHSSSRPISCATNFKSSSRGLNPQLVHQLGCNLWLHTLHLLLVFKCSQRHAWVKGVHTRCQSNITAVVPLPT